MAPDVGPVYVAPPCPLGEFSISKKVQYPKLHADEEGLSEMDQSIPIQNIQLHPAVDMLSS